MVVPLALLISSNAEAATVPLQAVLFDWDGTLLDSFDADSSAYLAMFRELGIPWGMNELAAALHAKLASRLPRRQDPTFQMGTRRQALGKTLRPSSRRSSSPAPASVLAWVARRYQLGLVTSGDRVRVPRQLRYFGLTRFSPRASAPATRHKKSHTPPLCVSL